MASPVAGDLNGDGVVDRGDVASLISGFGASDDATLCMGDLDGNGAVGLADLVRLQSLLGPLAVGASAAGSAVPEPTGMFLALGVGLAWCCACRTRRHREPIRAIRLQ
jgi:hypothetical protein